MRIIIDYARATSAAAAAVAAAAAAAAAALPLLLDACALCYRYTAAMRRLSIEATGARFAVYAWGVLCDVCVTPEVTARRQLFSLTGRVCSNKKQQTELPRQHAAIVVDKAHGGVIDVASAPCHPSAS